MKMKQIASSAMIQSKCREAFFNPNTESNLHLFCEWPKIQQNFNSDPLAVRTHLNHQRFKIFENIVMLKVMIKYTMTNLVRLNMKYVVILCKRNPNVHIAICVTEVTVCCKHTLMKYIYV